MFIRSCRVQWWQLKTSETGQEPRRRSEHPTPSAMSLSQRASSHVTTGSNNSARQYLRSLFCAFTCALSLRSLSFAFTCAKPRCSLIRSFSFAFILAKLSSRARRQSPSSRFFVFIVLLSSLWATPRLVALDRNWCWSGGHGAAPNKSLMVYKGFPEYPKRVSSRKAY